MTQSDTITPEDIAALFTRSDGSFFCARWGRPIAPIVFGVEDALSLIHISEPTRPY